jgi:hypothetical protein
MKILTLYLYIAGSLCFLGGSLLSLYTTKRPPETTDEAIAATDELARFADSTPGIDYYDARRDPPKADAPWTVELYRIPDPDKKESTIEWSESGYDHLMAAVLAIENAYNFCPNGAMGHQDAAGSHHLDCHK